MTLIVLFKSLLYHNVVSVSQFTPWSHSSVRVSTELRNQGVTLLVRVLLNLEFALVSQASQ